MANPQSWVNLAIFCLNSFLLEKWWNVTIFLMKQLLKLVKFDRTKSFICHDEHPRRWRRWNPLSIPSMYWVISSASMTRVLVVADETAIKQGKRFAKLQRSNVIASLRLLLSLARRVKWLNKRKEKSYSGGNTVKIQKSCPESLMSYLCMWWHISIMLLSKLFNEIVYVCHFFHNLKAMLIIHAG